MPTTSLPENPSLEHLRAQAKLVRDLIRSGDHNALSMVDEFHPKLQADELRHGTRSTFKTADAQLVIARLYRFPSWAKLRDHLAAVESHSFRPDAEFTRRPTRTDAFVEHACLNYFQDGPSPAERINTAHQMLAADATLGNGPIEALATVGDHQAIAALLASDATATNQPCGPYQWPPLLYAVYSRLSAPNPGWSATNTVRVLLDHGADPNAGFLLRGLTPPFTALTGAFGGGESNQPWHNDRLGIGRLLLDAGADPNDGQLLYNNGIGGQNHDDPSHILLLAEFGLGTQSNGPWYQRFGGQLREPAELLYDEVEAAAKRNRPKTMTYLISLGLDLDRPVGRSQQLPFRVALDKGHQAILELLAEAGHQIELTTIDEAVQFSRTNDTHGLSDLLTRDPELLDELLRTHPGMCQNTGALDTSMLQKLIELGFDINDCSDTKTALHHAAETNDLARTKMLIANGADPNVLDTHVSATPLGWARYFGSTETADYLQALTSTS